MATPQKIYFLSKISEDWLLIKAPEFVRSKLLKATGVVELSENTGFPYLSFKVKQEDWENLKTNKNFSIKGLKDTVFPTPSWSEVSDNRAYEEKAKQQKYQQEQKSKQEEYWDRIRDFQERQRKAQEQQRRYQEQQRNPFEDTYNNFYGSQNKSSGSQKNVSAVSTSHSVLFVTSDAPSEVIEAAYRALIKKHHPDAGGDTQTAAKINQAYSEIKKLK